MMSKNLVNYLKYSGVWVSFALNPYHWRLSFKCETPTDMDPAMYIVNIAIGPVNVRALLDDGSW